MPLPIPGSVAPGQLLIDAQSRQMWFGVADTIDINLSVLVGDIVALMAEDADIRVDTAAALAAGLATKSNTGHTHTAAQITDFVTAVQAVPPAAGSGSGVPPGSIIMWAGLLTAIGVGSLAGWVLCDGTNGTPDMQDRFVRGAGRIATRVTGGSADLVGTTNGGGAHSHGGNTTASVLTVAQLPAHAHGVTDPGHIHAITDPGHTHSYTRYAAAVPGNAYSGGTVFLSDETRTTGSKTTGISIQNHTTGLTVNNAGSDEGHSHPIPTEGAHVHTFSVVGANNPPWLSLAFIMKL